MDRVWFSIYAIIVVFVGYNSAGVTITSAPTKVVVIKPEPFNKEIQTSKGDLDTKNENQETQNLSDSRPPNTIRENSSSFDSEVQKWPRVFILSHDPHYPVICYSGKTININKTNNNNTVNSTLEDNADEKKDSNKKILTTKKFILSSDPLYPVLCQEGHIPANLTDDGTVEEGGITYDISNVTCVRRDYEKNISAIFLNKVGTIQTAWNIFNSSIEYGYFNINNVESVGHIKVLNETIVDCDEYDFEIDEKYISPGSAASLLG